MNEDLANELLQEIGHAIIHDPALKGKRWQSLSLVFSASEDSMGMHGYFYTARNKPNPFCPEGDSLFDLFPALQAAMLDGEKGSPWLACLLQIMKATKDIKLDFEYEDPDRWQVTPDNYETMPAALRWNDSDAA